MTWTILNYITDIVEQTVLPNKTPPQTVPDMNNAILEDPFPQAQHKLFPSKAASNNNALPYNDDWHSNRFGSEYHHGYGDGINLRMVQEILKKTSTTVEDLDKYLAVNGETKPSKN